MGLHLLHGAAHGGQALRRHQGLQPLHPQVVGRHLSLQIGNQLVGIAHRKGSRTEAFLPGRLQQQALPHQGHVVEQQTLLLNRGAVGRHRSRCDAAHIGVMAPTGHKRRQLLAGKHRADHREVGQVGSAVERVV